jgi:hypothetical protein
MYIETELSLSHYYVILVLDILNSIDHLAFIFFIMLSIKLLFYKLFSLLIYFRNYSYTLN